MAPDIPPDRGGRAQPAPRRRAGGSRGRGGEKTEGSARSGESHFFADATSGLPRLPLDTNARRCQGRDERCGPRAGLSAGCAAAEKDKRSSPASAETATGRLRALRIERARPERAMAHGTIEEDLRRGETDRYPRGSGKPYGAIGERGFPPPGYRSPAGPVRCGRGRAVLTALRLDNGLHHREAVVTEEGRRPGNRAIPSCSP